MSEEENQQKWNTIIDIGNKIHNPYIMKGEVRTLQAQLALQYAKDLFQNRFILSLPKRDADLCDFLVQKIACYLDGNVEVIQHAVKEYFLSRHVVTGLDKHQFQISFAPKRSGIQIGFICVIGDGTQTTRYFVKTHQHGPTEDNMKSLHPPDTKELFIYQFLNHLGIGPEVHFIVPTLGSKMTIYIATKDCHLTLLSQLTKETASMKVLVQLDLICRILCLRDCSTNTSNCGQFQDHPMIVDFRIENQLSGYVKSDIVAKFLEGNGEFNYSGLMASINGISQEQKVSITRESLQMWNLLETIDKTMLQTQPLFEKIGDKVNLADDLQRYVQDVKKTIENLSQI